MLIVFDVGNCRKSPLLGYFDVLVSLCTTLSPLSVAVVDGLGEDFA
jgi:hypothetical protein